VIRGFENLLVISRSHDNDVVKLVHFTAMLNRLEVVPTADNLWVLQKAVIAYSQETDLKNGSKAIK
jgi:hypothetical protein